MEEGPIKKKLKSAGQGSGKTDAFRNFEQFFFPP